MDIKNVKHFYLEHDWGRMPLKLKEYVPIGSDFEPYNKIIFSDSRHDDLFNLFMMSKVLGENDVCFSDVVKHFMIWARSLFL